MPFKTFKALGWTIEVNIETKILRYRVSKGVIEIAIQNPEDNLNSPLFYLDEDGSYCSATFSDLWLAFEAGTYQDFFPLKNRIPLVTIIRDANSPPPGGRYFITEKYCSFLHVNT